MNQKERHEKITEAVAQIGRLVGVCAQVGLDQDDILIAMQTATSMLCEINDIPIKRYIQFLYVAHKVRTDKDCNLATNRPEDHELHAEIAALFAPITN